MQTIKNIFLTDDDTDDCMLFSEILEGLFPAGEVQLTITNDGVELMQQLALATNSLPDLIFLDLNMPRKNGFECLQEIRNAAHFKSIPIVIFSTSSNPEIVERTYKNGASYYICKPQSYALLRKTIAHVLSLDDQALRGQPKRENFFITVS